MDTTLILIKYLQCQAAHAHTGLYKAHIYESKFFKHENPEYVFYDVKYRKSQVRIYKQSPGICICLPSMTMDIAICTDTDKFRRHFIWSTLYIKKYQLWVTMQS